MFAELDEVELVMFCVLELGFVAEAAELDDEELEELELFCKIVRMLTSSSRLLN